MARSYFLYLPGRENNRGFIAVGEGLWLDDGDTARVLRASPLQTLRELGTAGLEFAGAAALKPPFVHMWVGVSVVYRISQENL